MCFKASHLRKEAIVQPVEATMNTEDSVGASTQSTFEDFGGVSTQSIDNINGFKDKDSILGVIAFYLLSKLLDCVLVRSK